MNDLTRLAVVLSLSFSCGILSTLSAQTVSPNSPQTKPIKKVPGATVSGRVTVQGKGKGGVFVGFRPVDFGPQLPAPVMKAVTDADGNYHLPDIPPGHYHILPLAPAYVVSEYTTSGQGKVLILAEGERVDGIDFSMVRGAVVTGKVTHPDGKPLIDEPVYIVAAQTNQRDQRFSGSSRFQTDDRGVYRIYGISPGRYKVSIGASDDTFVPNRNRQTFVRVFYPGVTDFEEAKVVELSEGSEATNIDITVGQSLQNFAASGIIVDGETNQPVPNVRVGLQKIVGRGGLHFLGSSTVSNGRGEFRLENITPGKYSVTMMPQPDSDVRIDPLPFEIVDQDVSGLNIRTLKGAAVSGFIVLEGNQNKEVYARLAKMRLYAVVRAAEGARAGAGRTATIGADGSFRVGGLQAGSASFWLSSPTTGPQSGFAISRLERESVVQPRTGIEIKSGEQITGVRVIVAYGSGIVRGSVKIDTGPLPSGIQLMVRLIRTGENLFGIRPQETDARGNFVFEGVPAGTYELSVTGSIPLLRGRPASVKQSVTVTDGGTTEVQLVIDTDPNTAPVP